MEIEELIINSGDKQVATIDSARQSQIEAGLPALLARNNILEYEGFRARIDMAKPQQVDCSLFIARVNKRAFSEDRAHEDFTSSASGDTRIILTL